VADDDEGDVKTQGKDGTQEVIRIVARVAQLVFFALAAICILALICLALPTNNDNGLVKTVTDLGNSIAGPFKDVFEAKSRKNRDRAMYGNYLLAAGVYALLGVVVGRLGSRFASRSS